MDKRSSASGESPPDLYEALREAGYRWTIRDSLDELIADIRERPKVAFACAAAGIIFGAATVIVPALIIAWVQL